MELAGKKLNLKWVTDVIGDDYYKKWRKGDIILINAQTGTGKTYFIKKCLIPYIEEYERLLYICNRTNLKRQLKKDLLEQFGEEVPYLKDKNGEYLLDKDNNKVLDIEAVDIITTIGNITITSYHALQDNELDRNYGLAVGSGEIDFDYVVLDECHYLFADSSFNSKCRVAVDKIMHYISRFSTKIFISATMGEVETPIKNMNKRWIGDKPRIWEYSTGVDYSYVNTKYFKYLKDIITKIKNDKTDEKWLVFVSRWNDAIEIKEKLGEDNVEAIKAGEKESSELKNIINNSKFEKKVLVTTKFLDNGVNFNDGKLNNIVIMAWDKITFIQELGRKRIDIDNAEEVNLYINTRYKKSFESKVKDCEYKRKIVELWQNDNNQFNRNYDNNIGKLAKMEELFYRDDKTGKWELNNIGNLRLFLDLQAFKEIVQEFELLGKYAFILKQLEWIGQEDTFAEENLIEQVEDDEKIENIEDYLESIVNKVMLQATDRKELIEKIHLIDTHHSNIKKDRIKLLKKYETLNSYLKEINSNFTIKEFPTSRIINGKKKNFKSAWKVLHLADLADK
ncbi:MAG: DEAD/DEAH box helicase family protein [Bacillota bacterium]|nr:DEAD/DEAH box helicase family protein [Bacillota bacterium]